MPLCYVTLYNLYSYYFALSTERTWFDYISLLIIPCITIMWQIKKPWTLNLEQCHYTSCLMVKCHYYRNCTLSSDFNGLHDFQMTFGSFMNFYFYPLNFFHRKGEKRDLCCAWECSDTDGGISGKHSNTFIFSQGIYVAYIVMNLAKRNRNAAKEKSIILSEMDLIPNQSPEWQSLWVPLNMV